MNEHNRLNLLLDQAKKAAVSRDFDFAEKILLSQEVEDIAGVDNPRVLFELGNIYMKAERFEDAFSVFRRLYALQPKNTKVINKIGAIYRRMGEYENSLAVLLRAHSLGDKSPELLYNLGNTYKEMHAFESAKDCFRRALALNPNDTLAYNHIGTIECLMGNYSRALAEYRNGLRSDPNHPFIHFNMARVYRLLGQHDAAEREYIAAIKSRPNWRKALNELSSLYKGDGELEKQAVVLDRLLSIDNKNLPALIDRAEIAEKLGHFTDARDFFMQAVAADPHNPLPAEKYADFLLSAGEFEKAAKAIEAYNELNPDDKSLMLDLADAYLEAGRNDEAEELLKACAAEPLDETRELQLSAKLHLVRGEKDAARQDIEKILSGDLQNIGMRKELAEQLAEVGLLDEARSQLSLYSKEHPDDLSSDLMLGAISEQEGNFDDAIEHYTAVIEKERDNMRANEALARLYQRMGSGDSAVRLAGDSIAAQSAKQGARDLSMLQDSIRLYEQAARQYQMLNQEAAERNLQALARLQDELKSAAAEAMQQGEPDQEEAESADGKPASPPTEDEDKVDIASLLKILQGAEGEADVVLTEETEEDEDIPQLAVRVEPQPSLQPQAPLPSPQMPFPPQPAPLPPQMPFPPQAPLPPPPPLPMQPPVQQQAPLPPQPAPEPPQPAPEPQQPAPEPQQEEEAPLQDEPEEEEEALLQDEPEAEEEEAEIEADEDSSFPEEEAEEAAVADSEVAECGVLGLLKYLKDSLKFLPEEDQDKYRKSDERMIMEYLISKLSGRPGLRKSDAAKSAHEASMQERSESGEGGNMALSETFSLLADLSASLPDKDFAGILGKHVETVRGKLKSLEDVSCNPAQPPQA